MTYEALGNLAQQVTDEKSFVRFLKSYAEHAQKDSGGVTVFYL